MSISPEVAKAVDEIRKDRDLIASMRKADDLRDQQLADLKAQVAAHPTLSDEDKKALTDAVSDAQDLNHSLEGPVVANTQTTAPIAAAPPAAPSVPLMPTSAFDPNPHSTDLAEGSGQPPQSKAIATAGGFVVSGGGTTQRAPEPVVEPAAEAAPEALPAAAAEPAASEPAVSTDAPAAIPEPSPGQLPFTTPAGQDAAAVPTPTPDAAPAPIPPAPDPVSAPTPGPATFTPPPPSNPAV